MTPLQAKSLALLNLQKRDANEAERERQGDALRATIISDDEIENIIESAIRTRARSGRGITTEELQMLVNTIIGDRYAAGLSEMAGKGLLDIEFDPTKPAGQRIDYDIREDIQPQIKQFMENERGQTQVETIEAT